MEDVKAMEWLKDNGGLGSGDGSSDGSGSGSGCGWGCGSGSGCGYVDGYGYGDGSVDGDGYIDGSGDGSGYGSGYGDGSGYGFGCSGGERNAREVKKINQWTVCNIDGTPTCITCIKGNVAKGFVLNDDLTQNACYIVKGNGYFAHGKTLKEARRELVSKYMRDMDEDEVMNKFLSEFEKGEKYKGSVFFDWHNYLTGSCLMGRESFVKNHGLNLDDEFTVEEFFELCRNDYGGEVIKKLETKWGKEV